MSNYKYPYIPKEYYPAVMAACKYIRATGYFNKAVSYFADKYNLDEDELAKHIRKRQGAGQKASKNTRKYGYVAVEYSMGNERNGGCYFDVDAAQYTVKKATSVKNAQKALSQYDDIFSEYSPCHWFGRCEMFTTEDDAKREIEKWKAENTAKIEKQKKETERILRSKGFLPKETNEQSIIIFPKVLLGD